MRSKRRRVVMAGDGLSGLPAGTAVAVLCLVAQLVGRGAHALYFHIGETEKRCFIEEIPDETMVIGELRRATVWRDGARLCFWRRH